MTGCWSDPEVYAVSSVYGSVSVSFQDEADADSLCAFIEALGESDRPDAIKRLKAAAKRFARPPKRRFYKSVSKSTTVERLQRTSGVSLEFDLEVGVLDLGR